jgi:NADH-quinone oxidoreductase subunit L
VWVHTAAAAFHLVTHAFFKALLFLGLDRLFMGWSMAFSHQRAHRWAGYVEYGWVTAENASHLLDLPGIGGFALSGFPLITAGFWSKDEILAGAFSSDHLVVFLTLAVAAFLTAFYTMRQISLTFLGKPRTAAAEHASESKWTMTFPLVLYWHSSPLPSVGLASLMPSRVWEAWFPIGLRSSLSVRCLFT